MTCADAPQAPTVVSLFSGIGGLDLGLQQAGFRHLLMCEGGGDPNGTEAEREQWATGRWRRDVLRARFPGVPCVHAVQDVDAGRLDQLGIRGAACDRRAARPDGQQGAADRADLLAGGFPCQDLSVAGNRAGLAGSRSGLFFEFARVAGLVRPRWLLVENVPGLLSSNGGRDFGVVLGTLADLGYGLAWRVLDSRFFGVPQRRRRVFIVGARADGDPRAAAERAGQVLAVGSRCPRHPATRGEARENLAGTLGGGAGSRGWASDVERMTFIAETVRSHPRPGSNSNGNFVEAPLTSGGHPNSNAPGRRKEDDENLVAFHPTQDPSHGPISHALGSEPTGSVAVALYQESEYGIARYDEAGSLRAGRIPEHQMLTSGASVRRLMPVECCRLQAIPDDWFDGVPGTSDLKMYAGLGDAVAATVGEWIGRRIVDAP